MGEFVKVRGLPAHGGICQGKGSTHSRENSSRQGVNPLTGEVVKARGQLAHGGIRQGKGVYPLVGEFVKVRGLPTHGEFVKVRDLPTHGRIRHGRGSTRSWGNSSR